MPFSFENDVVCTGSKTRFWRASLDLILNIHEFQCGYQLCVFSAIQISLVFMYI